MLYVFNMTDGSMNSIDVKFAFQKVSILKEELEKVCKIRACHQVLLMNGGGNLDDDAQVSSYSTGTDTNPVYLFSKLVTDSVASAEIIPTEYTELSRNIFQQMYASARMPSTFKTLMFRSDLAQEFMKRAQEYLELSQNLIQEQRVQRKGWSAVVFHLDDVIESCELNADKLEKCFDTYMLNRQEYTEILQDMDGVTKMLAKIPILPGLPEKNADLEECGSICDRTMENQTLLNWISSQKIQQLTEQCSRGFQNLSKSTIDALRQEVVNVADAGSEENLRELKRVCDRLSTLDQSIRQCKEFVQDQVTIIQSFQKDKNCITDMHDEGYIADLCMSHHNRLVQMQSNDCRIIEIWKNCVRAKRKLSSGIQRRLNRIVEIESMITVTDGKIVMFNDSLNRLQKEFETLKQVHSAPEMYASAAVEAVRRKNFSQSFLSWANEITSKMRYLYNQEMDTRERFQNKFAGHFLNSIFLGLEDIPPAFATEKPPVFDDRLPNLTVEDLKILKNEMPDTNFGFSLPDLNTTAVNFFKVDIVNCAEKEDSCKIMNTSTTETNYSTNSFEENIDCADLEHDCSISKVIQVFDKSTNISDRKQQGSMSRRYDGNLTSDNFELFDYESLIKARNEKIESLEYLIRDRQANPSNCPNDNFLEMMNIKLAFEQENLRKLQNIYQTIQITKKEEEMYREKMVKSGKSVRMIETFLSELLNKYETTSKDLYDY